MKQAESQYICNFLNSIGTRFFKWRSFFDCQNLLMAITREIIDGS